MALEGYPQTKDHPKHTFLVEGESVTSDRIAYIKAHGDDATDWIEYQVKMPNSAEPERLMTIRLLASGSLYGPFSYVLHYDEGPTGGTGVQNCYTQVIEMEI